MATRIPNVLMKVPSVSFYFIIFRNIILWHDLKLEPNITKFRITPRLKNLSPELTFLSLSLMDLSLRKATGAKASSE